MIEHDCDTDEDCEVYFLKPVNEYNIVDKIKEANRELFDEGASTDPMVEQRRKVKFRPNLEEYEPNPDDERVHDYEAAEDLACYEVLTRNTLVDNNEDISISTIEECAEMLALEVQKKIEAIEIKMPDSDDEVEEICEEIVVMDMDTGRRLEDDTKQLNAMREKANRSPSIDEESKPEPTTEEVESNDDEKQAPEEEEEEEDDKLSIIVASYLPPECSSCDDDISKKAKQSFSRHFSFRRRNSGKRRNGSGRSPDITNLKLNYKTCCEYRNSEGGKLPKYTGYMSEYGLSRDQLDKREQTSQKKHKVVVEKNLKASEAEVRKMQDNERAFTTWLKNKMRFPINRTKNMFDVKKASCSNANGRSGGIFRQKFCSGNNTNNGVL